jgi:hypothetical protein
MATSKTPRTRSEHEPRVRDGLCRHIRSKGMVLNMHESPENQSSQQQYLKWDKNALPWDSTVWWCMHTYTPLGPDDRPCHKERCTQGRSCFESPGDDRVA